MFSNRKESVESRLESRQKASETPSQQIPGYGGMCLPSQLCGRRRIMVQAEPGINANPYSQNKKSWSRGSIGRVPAWQAQVPQLTPVTPITYIHSRQGSFSSS
jgi:hypothetical protein